MFVDIIPKIVQAVIALILLILTIVNWKMNHIGANIINFQAVVLWIIGLEQIVIPYRWFTSKQKCQYEVTLLLSFIFIIGKLFEFYNPNFVYLQFNEVCKYNVLIPLLLNLAFILLIILAILLYAVRHVYRLITEQLLSNNSHLTPQEMNKILALRRPFSQIQQENNNVSQACSICLLDFQPDVQAIMLPGCHHCFHHQCIQNWLQTKATCPYCRDNIRFSLL